MRGNLKTLALLLSVVLMFAFLYKSVDRAPQSRADISFSEFVTYVKGNKIQDVTFKADNIIAGKFKEPINEKTTYETVGNTGSDKVFELLEQNNLVPNYDRVERPSFLQQFLYAWAPMLLFFLFFVFIFMRQMNAGGGKAMSFGKSRARLHDESNKKITFADVAGADEAKQELREIVYFLKDPKKFTRLGGKIPKGVLLMGPPGTGKTLLARAVAGEAGVPFFTISGSDFVEMFVGVGASRVRDLFENAKKRAPCIVFIDEIDAVGRHRGAGLGGGHDEREQTLNQLLVEMDGFEANEGVILVAATNRPDVLDPALLRPGRFDRRVVVSNPDMKGREEILKVHTRKVPLGEAVNLRSIAKGTPGFSGADLANLVNEAALIAASADKKTVELTDLEEAKDKVLMGPERRSMVISDQEKRTTAYHEAGHTLVGKILPGRGTVHKVTIIPRGRALGVTQTLPDEDRLVMDKEKAENEIAVLMGGRLAEELVFNEKTTGAGNDIERATDIARRMVCEWGMSDVLGPMTFGKKDGEIFLGREITQNRDYSEQTAQTIDREIREIVDRNYQRAKKILRENIATLHRIAEALLDLETIDGEEVELLMKGERLPRTKAVSDGTPPTSGHTQEGGGAAPAPLPA